MKKLLHAHRARLTALLLVLVMLTSILAVPASAGQEDGYHDPAEHWLDAGSRTNELDANAVVTHETYYCWACGKETSFHTFRTPEYTKDGKSALTRNVKYSDGTCIDGVSTGAILDGTPGKDASYTGCHWTKTVCENCGEINSNMAPSNYGHGKNVYWLYDCDASFMETLPETVSYEYVDSGHHMKTTEGGTYCCFCYGTNHTSESVLEPHDMETEIIPQPANARFAVTERCRHCSFEKSRYVTAKSVIADYYGVVDGQPHTVTVTDLSDAGVTTQIRYGNSADSCTMTSAPNYTEEGQYTVYYEITYTYHDKSMTENGVAYVWLRDESEAETPPDSGCTGEDGHHFVHLDTVPPTCTGLGYDRYLCVDCGRIEKRDYVGALGHNWQGVVVREPTCETDGKLLEICSRCGQVRVKSLPKGEHRYETHTVEPTCTSPGYTLKECSVCGDRHIIEIIPALPHNFEACVVPPTCETGGYTIHRCEGCGSSFITDYTEPLGHLWDEGRPVTNATCTGEGVMEYRCLRCGCRKLEGDPARGHVPGNAATCTTPQLCTKCGAVLQPALGHDYEAVVTEPTCTEMGYTTFTCSRCGDTYRGDYTEPAGHKAGDWIIDKAPTTTSEGSRHKECTVCGKVLETEKIEKIYLSATTDTHGEAVVGGYLVTVTDTDTGGPIAGAGVLLHEDGSISICLPEGRLIDYEKRTTVTVQLLKDRSAVPGIPVAVTDRNDNYCRKPTDTAGRITVPDTTGVTNGEGNATVGCEDEDGNRTTITVRVEKTDTGRPIENAEVSAGKGGNITVKLPDGTDMDETHRITVTVTDNRKRPQKDRTVIVKDDRGNAETGKTDENGQLTVPEEIRTELHSAYIYGYPDGRFGPEDSMSRSEAAAIFARLLAAKNHDDVSRAGRTKFPDVPPGAWYSGYVRYLEEYEIVRGTGSGLFVPDAPISRAEFVTMAVRFFSVFGDASQELPEYQRDFSDVTESSWAAEYIREAALHGWVLGYEDGSFCADRNIARAEAVAILNRLLGRSADRAYVKRNLRRLHTFPDLSRDHWAYYEVLEAANPHTAVFDPEEHWRK